MNNFKSFLASAALAVSTLGFVAVSAPAQACTNCGGLKLNGVETNGLTLNGIRVNGLSLNGVRLNGFRFNGIELNGMRINGVQLQGPQLQGPLLQGTDAGTAQSGRFVAITLPSGETVALR